MEALKKPINKKTLAIIAVPIAVLAWAAFRPELLFVNKSVNEKLPVSATAKLDIISQGSFVSGAHETKGIAEIVSVGGKNYLQLRDFSSSNGPDVRVIALRSNATENSAGAIDLGENKANIGTQNYELPSTLDPATIKSISIWCRRFSVGFGRADLSVKAASVARNESTPTRSLGSTVSFESDILVTTGMIKGNSQFAGKASIIEASGKRVVRLDFSKVASGRYAVKLLKKETLSLGQFDTKLPSLDLGTVKKGRTDVAIPKEIDAWLYRSVAIISGDKVIGFANLRSTQEKQASITGSNWA